MQNSRTLGKPLVGISNPSRRRKKEKEKKVNRGHYVLPATPKGSALTLLGTIQIGIENDDYEPIKN